MNKKSVIERTSKEVIEKESYDNRLFFAQFNKSCLVTYVGILFAALSMYFAFGGFLEYSLSCLIISGICDMYDGKFARAFKRTVEEKEFGIQLDSLADTICFIVTPVVIMLSIGMREWYHVIIYTLFFICGVSRLGYFNITTQLDKSIKTYRGLPVTSVAIIFPIIGFLHMVISTEILTKIYLIATFLISLLFVVNIRIPKLKGKAYIWVPVFAILGIVFLLVK